MFVYWPFLVLILPLTATLLRLRTAWVWLSLAIGFAMIWAIMLFVTWDWAHGRTGWPFADLLRGSNNRRVLHDTYYVVAYLEWLGRLLIPCVAMTGLYLIKAHPRRTPLDVALFWGAVILCIAANYAPRLYLWGGGMPRRYVGYEGTMFWLNLISKTAAILMLVLIVIAALRPIQSWSRARKDARAL